VEVPGRFALVKDAELIGTYAAHEDALAEGARRFGLQSFLVRRVDDDRQPVFIPALDLGILSADSQHPVRK
jgi:hypothetical protein